MNIRRSLYKHAFGTAKTKPDQMLSGLKPIFKADTVIKANATFFAVPWDSAGGSCLAVFPLDTTGRLDPRKPVRTVRGHQGPVLDFDFDPYDDHLLATACDDTLVRIFEIPEGGLGDADLEEPLVVLEGHERKATNVLYHPTAKNVIVSASQDQTVRVWNAITGECKTIVEHPDQIYGVTWNYDGSLLATTCRDKVLRIIDPRTGEVLRSVEECHGSTKPTRVCWLGQKGRILTTGFSKQGEREHAMWNAEDLSLMHRETLELSPSQLQPFYDEDTGVLFLAGKGEARMRYVEIIDDAPYHFALSEYSGTPCKGLAMLPKSCVNVKDCEIARFYMLTRDTIEPVHFVVPRKAATFQSDIFPDTRSFEQAPLSAEDFFAGSNADPVLTSMAPTGRGSSAQVSTASSRLAASSRLGRSSNATAGDAANPTTATTTTAAAAGGGAKTNASAPKPIAAPAGASEKERIAALEKENARQASVIEALVKQLETVKTQVEDQAGKIKELAK